MDQSMGWHQHLRALRPVLKVVVAGFAVVLVIRAVGVFSDWIAIGAPISRSGVDAHRGFSTVVRYVLLVAAVTGMAALATWQVRARRNAVLISPFPQRHSSAMAGWSWFIPFANMVLPGRVLSDLWRSTDPATREHHTRAGGGDPVTRWWGALVAFGIAMILVEFLFIGVGRVVYSEQAYRASLTRTAIGNTVMLLGWIVLFVRGYRLLDRISTWQDTAAPAVRQA
jgi:hypothetical protein